MFTLHVLFHVAAPKSFHYLVTVLFECIWPRPLAAVKMCPPLHIFLTTIKYIICHPPSFQPPFFLSCNPSLRFLEPDHSCWQITLSSVSEIFLFSHHPHISVFVYFVHFCASRREYLQKLCQWMFLLFSPEPAVLSGFTQCSYLSVDFKQHGWK